MPRKKYLHCVRSNCLAEVRILWVASSCKGNLSLQGDLQIQRWSLLHGLKYLVMKKRGNLVHSNVKIELVGKGTRLSGRRSSLGLLDH